MLSALRKTGTISVALDSGGRAPATRAAPANGRSGPYRAGSLPAKLLAWAGKRKSFGVPDVMKALRIKRGHASMLLAYVGRGGAVKRVGRGKYKADRVTSPATR